MFARVRVHRRGDADDEEWRFYNSTLADALRGAAGDKVAVHVWGREVAVCQVRQQVFVAYGFNEIVEGG